MVAHRLPVAPDSADSSGVYPGFGQQPPGCVCESESEFAIQLSEPDDFVVTGVRE